MERLQKIERAFSGSTRRRTYYAVYTLLFLILVLLCYSYFLFSGRSFIWMTDGWALHFKGLVYYSKYLREILHHIVYDHQLIIPDWDFYIGEGNDVIGTLHYYLIGDPIAALCVFVPTKYMQYFYSFAYLLRLYLAGIAFSELCFGTGSTNRYAVLAGSIAYCFCGRTFGHCIAHPDYIGPLILFPLLILGVENIIRKKKAYLFIITVAISSLFNIYFFYMFVVLLVIYVFARLIILNARNIKATILTILSIGAYGIVGTAISGIIFLPAAFFLLNDSRASLRRPFSLFYPFSYYSGLPGIVLSERSDYELYIGLAVPVIIALFLLFKKRKSNTLLKVLFIISSIMLVLPLAGSIMNGMSYSANRWCFAIVLLYAFIFQKEWDELFSVSRRDWLFLLACSIAYYLIILHFDKSRTASALSSIPLMFLALILINNDTKKQLSTISKSLLMIGIVIICVVNMAFWSFSFEEFNTYPEYIENGKVWEEWDNNEARVMKALTGDGYSRYTGSSLTENTNMFNDISNTQYYWSVPNPYVNTYRNSLSLLDSISYCYEGYDDRTTPIALSGSIYYVAKNGASSYCPPYGFEYLDSFNSNTTGEKRIEELKRELETYELSDAQISKIMERSSSSYSLYKNNFPLPLAYCYDTYITKAEWDALDAVQKQEILLNTAYVDKQLDNIPIYEEEIQDYKVPCEIECNGTEITQTDNGFVTTSNQTTITLRLVGEITGSEIYVGVNGLVFRPTVEYDLYFGDDDLDPQHLYNKTNWDILSEYHKASIRKDKRNRRPKNDSSDITVNDDYVKKNIGYLQPESSYANGRTDFIANLGYREEPIGDITLTFDERGVYNVDEICVYAIPFENFAEKIKNRGEHTLHNMSIATNTIMGSIELDTPQILCIATSYSPGWKAYVDEEQTELLCVNEHYLGLVIPQGLHDIRLTYSTPLKKEGAILSLFGILALAVIGTIDKVRTKNNKERS